MPDLRAGQVLANCAHCTEPSGPPCSGQRRIVCGLIDLEVGEVG